MHAVIGLIIFPFIAWLIREKNPSTLHWKSTLKKVLFGLFLQFIIAISFSYLPLLSSMLEYINQAVGIIDTVTAKAAQFIFGYLSEGPSPFLIENPKAQFITAFRVFPLIITVGVFGTILYHLGIIPLIIKGFSKLLQKTLGVSGPLSLGAAGSLYFGTIETLVLIRPYLLGMSRHELFSLICCSLATLAGSVMILYATVLEKIIDKPLAHIMIASMISIPAALTLASIVVPDTKDTKDLTASLPEPTGTLFEGILGSVRDSVRMIADIAGLIIALFAIVYTIDIMITAIIPGYSLRGLVAIPLRPILWCTGLSWSEAQFAAPFMASKIILNEFVAFTQLRDS